MTRFFIVQRFFVLDDYEDIGDTVGAEEYFIIARGANRVWFFMLAPSDVTGMKFGAEKFWLVIWCGKILIGH